MNALTNSTVRRSMQHAFAITAMLLSANALFAAPKPAKTSNERHGQVKFSSAKEQIVGNIVIQFDGENFRADITKDAGVPLMKISATFATDPKNKEDTEKHMRYFSASGPLAHGNWSWRWKDLGKNKLKDFQKVWTALPEVYMWGQSQAKGEPFRVYVPNIVMHARAGDGEVKRFDYTHHENTTGGPLPMKDLKKQRALETIICHLD